MGVEWYGVDGPSRDLESGLLDSSSLLYTRHYTNNIVVLPAVLETAGGIDLNEE
jgi:hypothetical protein